MTRKRSKPQPKSLPLQVRMDPDMLAAVRAIAPPGDLSAWVREAISRALEAPETAPEPPAAPVDPVDAKALAAAEKRLAEALLAAVRQAEQSTARRLNALQQSVDETQHLARSSVAAMTLLAGQLGVSAADLGRMVIDLKPRM